MVNIKKLFLFASALTIMAACGERNALGGIQDNSEKLSLLKLGMSRSEVENILGAKPDLMPEVAPSGMQCQIYLNPRKISDSDYVLISYKNEKVEDINFHADGGSCRNYNTSAQQIMNMDLNSDGKIDQALRPVIGFEILFYISKGSRFEKFVFTVENGLTSSNGFFWLVSDKNSFAIESGHEEPHSNKMWFRTIGLKFVNGEFVVSSYEYSDTNEDNEKVSCKFDMLTGRYTAFADGGKNKPITGVGKPHLVSLVNYQRSDTPAICRNWLQVNDRKIEE